MKNILLGIVDKKNFWQRSLIVLFAILFMGASLSMLIQINLGMDPCTLMNCAISAKLGMSLGNWQALLNTILLIVVLFFGEKNIGIGTILNMFLMGYMIELGNWMWSRILPAGLFDSMAVRVILLFPALAVFVLSAALYMDVDMGTAPYDALPYVIASRLPKVPFRVVRICFDFTVTVIGMLFGGMPGIMTILMVLTLGPVITWLGGWLEKHFQIFREL